MSKPVLFATHPLFEAPRRFLAEHFDARFWQHTERPPREEFLRAAAAAEAVICLLTEKIDAEFFAAAPRVRIVANVAVGFDNINVAECTRHGVVATNTPGVLDETTADFTWALLLGVARRLTEAEAYLRAGQWSGWDLDQLCGSDVHGKTLGLIGFGRIGRAVARRAAGFNVRVIYYNALPASHEVEARYNVEYVSLDRLLAESDFISLHVPLMPETRHLISDGEFSKMKPTAYVINTARGPVVDEAALVRALDAGQIAGAALDVFEREPEVHPGLLGRKNVVLAPHIASASIETRTRMAQVAAENCVALFRRERPPNALNPEVLEPRARGA
jgi:glyoxylate reductase